jgi:hypothetical protein
MNTKAQKAENDKLSIKLRKLAKSIKEHTSPWMFFLGGIVRGSKIVVLKLPADIPGILLKARDFYDHTFGNPLFPEAQAMLPGFKAHIEDAFAFQAKMLGRGKAVTEKRNMAVSLVITEAFTLRLKVQQVVYKHLKDA